MRNFLALLKVPYGDVDASDVPWDVSRAAHLFAMNFYGTAFTTLLFVLHLARGSIFMLTLTSGLTALVFLYALLRSYEANRTLAVLEQLERERSER